MKISQIFRENTGKSSKRDDQSNSPNAKKRKSFCGSSKNESLTHEIKNKTNIPITDILLSETHQ